MDIYRQSLVKTPFKFQVKKLFILINKVSHHNVSNFIRAKVPSCLKRKLGCVKHKVYVTFATLSKIDLNKQGLLVIPRHLYKKHNKNTHTLWGEKPISGREHEC